MGGSFGVSKKDFCMGRTQALYHTFDRSLPPMTQGGITGTESGHGAYPGLGRNMDSPVIAPSVAPSGVRGAVKMLTLFQGGRGIAQQAELFEEKALMYPTDGVDLGIENLLALFPGLGSGVETRVRQTTEGVVTVCQFHRLGRVDFLHQVVGPLMHSRQRRGQAVEQWVVPGPGRAGR
ncbi:hypothetical protein BJP41_06805 [Candidatus Williamhamiltonella defendens]|uniref:Uncharacterized protein n=1 Tax=Candidatus Williamhamiltonella defendens TaxID=138072 RepID=A0A2D3T8G9_9ENTR|nr:hypothetical protein BJP41_06805 [Candidatus Hamiltonella defensa]ATW32087.1 hypothetical protein BJP42_07090 [Candidatus Hamiltonella defensa]